MTAQEIIEYLKENRLIGVVFKFMPDEVKEWISQNYDDPKLLYLTPGGKWGFFHQTDFGDYDNIVFALFNDYEIKKEQKGEWIECEINKNNDCFFINGHYYRWSEWNTCLIESCNGLKAFGGWQYEGSERWYLAPAVKLQDGEMWNSYVIEQSGEATPVIPVKIRFWREIK